MPCSDCPEYFGSEPVVVAEEAGEEEDKRGRKKTGTGVRRTESQKSTISNASDNIRSDLGFSILIIIGFGFVCTAWLD